MTGKPHNDCITFLTEISKWALGALQLMTFTEGTVNREHRDEGYHNRFWKTQVVFDDWKIATQKIMTA